ncbi:MAG: YkgJ family cysteine cluster protein [Methanosarcinaceae archaeon]|nr:YkgJ family cysteine cluster protein [Methanosarcinaceae archaeon]
MWRNRTNSDFVRSRYISLFIEELEQELSDALDINIARVASKIREIGFSCQKCGHCCRAAFGDNRVLLTQKDILKIAEHTGLSKSGIVTPMLPDDPGPFSFSSETPDIPGIDLDTEGNIHTFGWMLRRKSNGDCSFIGDEKECQNRCKIYDARPMLCSTYPFYMESMELQVSECEGLGHKISGSESLKLAQDVVRRYIAETRDTISLYRKFRDFNADDGGGLDIAARRAKEGRIVYVVHDSDGMHRIVGKFQ